MEMSARLGLGMAATLEQGWRIHLNHGQQRPIFQHWPASAHLSLGSKMTAHPEHWSISKRFSYEFGSAANHLRRFRLAYMIGAVVFVLLVSAVTWVRTNASVSDLPALLVASIVHLLRGVAIVSLLFAWLGARLVQEWLYARTSSAWVRREALRRPGVSFQVPYWRFQASALVVRWVVFAIWLGSLFLLLCILPGYALERFIPANFPF